MTSTLFTREHFQLHKFAYEACILFCYFAINAGINATSVLMEASRTSTTDFSLWEPIVWEYSSAFATLLLFPVIAIFLKRYPWNWQHLLKCLLALFIAGLIYSLSHVAIMVGLRELVYFFTTSAYQFADSVSSLLFELFYEARKDLWSFVFFVLLISVYRYAIGQWLGDAHRIDKRHVDEGSKPDSSHDLKSLGEMLLVRKLGKEFLIKTKDIEWAEACGNYVNLRIGEEFYPMRITMTDFTKQSSSLNIVRTHKSFAVNLNFVHSIESKSSGDAEVIMRSDKRIRLSRRYKNDFENGLASSQT